MNASRAVGFEPEAGKRIATLDEFRVKTSGIDRCDVCPVLVVSGGRKIIVDVDNRASDRFLGLDLLVRPVAGNQSTDVKIALIDVEASASEAAMQALREPGIVSR